jgi:UDP-2,3-diacylglucosamine pyrophosphatase LpxH
MKNIRIISSPRPDTFAIIVSDIHLGAIGSNHAQFKKFLAEINDPDMYPNLRILIIAGDLFDLLFISPRGLRKRFTAILKELTKLQDKGIKIVYILGNHEIPVSGPYEAPLQPEGHNATSVNCSIEQYNFFGWSEWYRGKLGSTGLLGNFIERALLCQYVVIERNSDNWKITPCNAIQELGESPSSSLTFPIITNQPATSPAKLLVCHGYQCKSTTLDFALTWEACLLLPDELKDILGLMYFISPASVFRYLSLVGNNPAAKNIETSDPELQETINKVRNHLKNAPPEQNKLEHYFRALSQSLIRKREPEGARDCQEAAEFVECYPELAGITHFLFGHTHWVYEQEIHGIRYINTGAWQGVPWLTHVEIDSKGNCEILEDRAKAFWPSLIFGTLSLALVIATVLHI